MFSTVTKASEPSWLPLEAWMQRDHITPSTLLRAERAGARVPAVEFGDHMLVDLAKLYDWRELAALLVKEG